jgi:glycosyltransferase involved in cell wall biosynthesis
MAPPLVSVIIPVYNGERYLRQALDSALEQTYPAIEVVAVDDGSTDTSPAILASYGGRIRVVRQTNRGVAEARNVGLRVARGSYLAFLDQDDWWLPEKIECQVERFQLEPDVGLVHTNVVAYNEVLASYADHINCLTPEYYTGDCFERLLLEGNALVNSGVMVRKEVLDDVGLLDTQIVGNTIQDYDLWLRVARKYTLAYVPKPLVVYRLHPQQGMWKVRDSLREELLLLDRILATNPDLPTSRVCRRLAGLLDQLGIREYDLRERRAARGRFARALGLCWSWRTAALWLLCFLPSWVGEACRRTCGWSRRAAGGRPGVAIPAWAHLPSRAPASDHG